jgi:hypothetical protein
MRRGEITPPGGDADHFHWPVGGSFDSPRPHWERSFDFRSEHHDFKSSWRATDDDSEFAGETTFQRFCRLLVAKLDR